VLINLTEAEVKFVIHAVQEVRLKLERKLSTDLSADKANPAALRSALSMWLDANDVSTITLKDGSTVSQWNDKSGNARHAYQAKAAAPAVRLTKAGRPAKKPGRKPGKKPAVKIVEQAA
jgi:hypothetical protein